MYEYTGGWGYDSDGWGYDSGGWGATRPENASQFSGGWRSHDSGGWGHDSDGWGYDSGVAEPRFRLVESPPPGKCEPVLDGVEPHVPIKSEPILRNVRPIGCEAESSWYVGLFENCNTKENITVSSTLCVLNVRGICLFQK